MGVTHITLQLPEDIAQRLVDRWKDLPRAALESLALEAYRSELLTSYELRRLLGMESRFELDSFLKEHGVYLEYTPEELEREAQASQQLWEFRQKQLKADKRHAE
jgi:hypothetical protein